MVSAANVDAEVGSRLPPADPEEAPVFVYGSLLCEEVRETLLDRPVEVKTGLLEGYRRHRLRNESYPGIAKVDPKANDGADRHAAVVGELLYVNPCFSICLRLQLLQQVSDCF